jgi:hypothetical protein
MPETMHHQPQADRPALRGVLPVLASAGLWILSGALASAALAQPVTSVQRSTATQVAQSGVPLSELAPTAPERHTIQRGDTLWSISGLFLRSPWRWPELWGMNMADIRNPHRIYPGQVLVLDKSSGRALLRLQGEQAELETVKVSPRTRYEPLSQSSVPPISLQAVEAFLTEALIVDEKTFSEAPRIVAAQEGRVLLSRGDRAYARSLHGTVAAEGLSIQKGQPRSFRVYRGAKPLKDPASTEILGFEAQYVGRAVLVRPETHREVVQADGKVEIEMQPATIDITGTKEEIRAGDRLIPEPPRSFETFVPQAPAQAQSGQIVAVHGSAVTYAAQNQVVVLNRGSEHGLENGHVLAVLKDGARLLDRTDAERTTIRLPNERNGLMMVFRTFDKLSYALVLEITDGVRVGDRFVNP